MLKQAALASREQLVQGLSVSLKYLCNLGMVLSPIFLE